MLSSCPEIRGIRDLSIYFVMFECALKRSELKKLQIEDISLQKSHALLRVGENKYQLSELACKAISKWVRLLYGSQGVLFRRIDKHSNIGTGQLDDSSIYRILRRASDLLGLPEHMKFNGQSARVGATKELQTQGYKLKEIQDFGRWMSPAMPAQYLEKTSTAEGEMAKFRAIKPWS
ncbi:tyrosine-type recombinase/integrase [Vibrio sp. SCSIO 43137]|nr:tyrosine-type recombinase/integrase [Vibrio sp. SCSIO 43137]WCE32635.1 tyrosine-type recombinase/integrase [Vibrio sp. SCSIO 43137]